LYRPDFLGVASDSWGSHESIQILQLQGYEAEHLSVDTAAQPYATLKEAIFPAVTFEIKNLTNFF